jgi:hypothetical protein
MMGRSIWTLVCALLAGFMLRASPGAVAANAPNSDAKPKVAIFPLAGSAAAADRDRVGFSMRAKLDRDGLYDPIDGPTMLDIASISKTAVGFDTPIEQVKELADGSGAAVLIWGDLSSSGRDIGLLRLNIVDLRQIPAIPRQAQKQIAQATDVRFAVEEILQSLPGVKPFDHPVEEALTADAASSAAWARNPDLVVDGRFADAGPWIALFRSEQYPPPISAMLPGPDKVAITRQPGPLGNDEPVLAMNLSEDGASSNGLACLSGPIAIQPNTRYRLQFRYRSLGPTTHVFVKGYVRVAHPRPGDPAEMEVYRRQVPPGAATGGKWVTVTDDMNPQNPNSPVQVLRIDLYAYLKAGMVMFDDVQLRAVGDQTHTVHDAALPVLPAATQPVGR